MYWEQLGYLPNTIWQYNIFNNELIAIAGDIFRFDGSSWFNLGNLLSNFPGQYAFASYVFGGVLYVRAERQYYRWNGSNWIRLGLLVNDYTSDLLEFNGNLYAATNYGVRLWDGSNWSNPIGSIGNADTLYNIGGVLTIISGGRVYQWNGVSWVKLGTLTSIRKLVIFNSAVYAVAYDGVYEWSGSSWTQLGTLSSYIWGLEVIDGVLTAAQSTIYGARLYVYQWNGASWTPLGSPFQYEYYELEMLSFNGYLVARGNSGCAYWSGSSWVDLLRLYNNGQLFVFGTTLFSSESSAPYRWIGTIPVE
jgi:hypothetical protein